MATYKFEQFNVEIVDPTISIDERSIMIDNIDLELDVTITLTTPNGSKFGVLLTNIPQNGGSWTNMDLELGVMQKLAEYEVTV